MDLKIDPVVLNGSNYAVWEPYMETLLKRKGLCQYVKVGILDPTDDHAKFIVDGKNDEALGVITTYILREIHFHLSGINYPHQVLKKLKSLFDRFDERYVMQMEKQLISLYPHSLEIMEDYLVCVKELQLKLGECEKNYQKKDVQLIKLVLMNLRIPLDVFVLNFYTNWKAHK
jgi:hypothetical protein